MKNFTRYYIEGLIGRSHGPRLLVPIGWAVKLCYPTLMNIKELKAQTIEIIMAWWRPMAMEIFSTWVQVMACCLTASSHYLNQRSLTINATIWHSVLGIFYFNTQALKSQIVFELHAFVITITSHRGQCVNSTMMTSSNESFFPRYWLLVRVIHRSPVNSTHKGTECGCFFDVGLHK